MSADEKLVYDVVLLAKQGMSRRAISRALKVGRNCKRRFKSPPSWRWKCPLPVMSQ